MTMSSSEFKIHVNSYFKWRYKSVYKASNDKFYRIYDSIEAGVVFAYELLEFFAYFIKISAKFASAHIATYSTANR